MEVQVRKIHFYGRLKKLFPKPIELDVQTAGEAIRAIAMQTRGFLDILKDGYYRVVIGKSKNGGLDLDIEDLNSFRCGAKDIHIVPVLAGSSSKGGIIKTLVGAAIIGAAIFFSGGTLAAPLAGAGAGILSGITYGNIAMLGVAIALSGISQLISKPSSKDKKDESFSLSGPGNVYGQGNAVPVLYGKMITGAVLISAGIDIEKIT